MSAGMLSLDSDCAVVIGAGHGIGRALADEILAREPQGRVLTTSRSFDRGGAEQQESKDAREIRVGIDATRPEHYSKLIDSLERHQLEPRLVFITTGMLHDDSRGIGPEKRLSHLEAETLQRLFQVNTVAPMIAIQQLAPLLPRRRPSLIAALSARVGSISDNRLGGWYSYRMSKAALNMGVHTAAIEIQRRCPENICVALHPGTVDTDLSAPFVKSKDPHKVFSPERAAQQLLDVVSRLTPDDSGNLFAWDGSLIPF